MTGITVAIDGPAGTGKSTTARAVAMQLGLAYFDTGATYRVGTVWCLREGVDLGSESDVAAMIATMNVDVSLDPANPRVVLDGEDVTALIRSDAVALQVSRVATNREARSILAQWQRDIIHQERVGGFSQGRGVVAEGRDITTVVAPEAEVRILMTANEDVRVARRAAEGAERATVRQAVVGRDALDSTVVNFTQAADGVVTLDTSEITIDEAVQAVISLVEAARG